MTAHSCSWFRLVHGFKISCFAPKGGCLRPHRREWRRHSFASPEPRRSPPSRDNRRAAVACFSELQGLLPPHWRQRNWCGCSNPLSAVLPSAEPEVYDWDLNAFARQFMNESGETHVLDERMGAGGGEGWRGWDRSRNHDMGDLMPLQV